MDKEIKSISSRPAELCETVESKMKNTVDKLNAALEEIKKNPNPKMQVMKCGQT